MKNTLENLSTTLTLEETDFNAYEIKGGNGDDDNPNRPLRLTPRQMLDRVRQKAITKSPLMQRLFR
jgi:hypothetical protein